MHFLDIVQHLCKRANVKHCQNEPCFSTNQKLNKVAPPCEWTSFRDFALVFISCQLNSNMEGSERGHMDWSWRVENLTQIAQCIEHEKMKPSVNLFDVCELINWLSAINSFIQPPFKYQLQPLRAHISKQVLSEATQTAHSNGICKNRLWNLTVGAGEREEVDLPILMKMLQSQEPARRSSDHDTCTAAVCCLSSIDSTRVRQLHKCPNKDCGESLCFPYSQVKSPDERVTWWMDESNGVPYVVNPKANVPYMAISHVWADGTGGGVQGEGLVNQCLFKYFKAIAEDLGCRAIWWDTICIPAERVARQKAINRMHENFREASHTIIHDESVLQSPWTNDGLPCLALLLSSWFTRAWTALELRMTQKGKVSVIYQGPNNARPYTLKNLDTDVLADHPAYFSRGHLVASSLVEQLREQPFNNIRDILKVVRTRSTSWPRDLLIVAALLTEHKPNVNDSNFIALTTRDIVIGLVVIEDSVLYHGQATMTEKGGWSWCPMSLLDVQLRTKDTFDEVYVDEQGAVTGSWKYRLLSKEDANNLHAYSFHSAITWQIRTALARWENCLLLQNPRLDDIKALLVQPLDVGNSTIDGKQYCVLDCQFVGTVYTRLEWGKDYIIAARLGKLQKDPEDVAEKVMDRYEDTEGVKYFFAPSGTSLKSLRETRKEFLATTRGT